MSSFSRRAGHYTIALTLAAVVTACQGEPLAPADRPDPSMHLAAKEANATASVTWNQVARDMVVKYGTSAPATIRMFALLTVAQYNAVVAAEKEKDHSLHPS